MIWHGYILLTKPEELSSGQWSTIISYLSNLSFTNNTPNALQPADRWHLASNGTSHIIQSGFDTDKFNTADLAQLYSDALSNAISAATIETYLDDGNGNIHWQVFAEGENLDASETECRHHRNYYGWVCRGARNPPFNNWYVATNGSENGDGSINDPWSLSYAVSINSGVMQGDTIWLRGGNYGVLPDIEITGYHNNEVNQPIILRGYPDDWKLGNYPIIEGTNNVVANDIRLWSIVSTGANSERFTSETSSNPPTYDNRPGITKLAPRIDLWNSFIYNANGVGIGDWDPSPSSENYGVLVQNNGWSSTDRGGILYDENGNRTNGRWGHGHGFYMQNTSGFKNIKHCIFLPGFGFTYTAHGTGAAGLVGITIDETVAYSFSSEVGNTGANAKVIDALVQNTIHWETGIAIGQNHLTGSASVLNNLIYKSASQALKPSGLSPFLVQGNRFVCDSNKIHINWIRFANEGSINATFTDNHYYGQSSDIAKYETEPNSIFSLSEWQALGYDLDGSYNSTIPAGLESFVWPNEKQDGSDPRIGIVVIVDWDEIGEATIDLSSLGLINGNSYKIFNAFNYFNDTPLIYQSDGIDTDVTINLSGLSIAIPEGVYNGVTMQEPLEPLPDKLRIFIIEES